MKQLYTDFQWGLTGEPQEMLVENGVVVDRTRQIKVSADVPRTSLDGKFLLPSFIDAHCHILPSGMDLLKLHLGACECHSDVLDSLRQRHEDQPDGWLHAVHYDQNRYGGVHLTRDQLDQISNTRPILLCHVNGHASVANSAALAAVGVTEATPDPEGGVYERDGSGRLTGVLLEAAHEFVTANSPRPNRAEMVEAIVRAGKLMRSEGIGCASDMMTGFFNLEDELASYQLAAEAGNPIHVRLYVQWGEVFGPRAAPDAIDRVRALMKPSERLGESSVRDVRVAGIKIFADGAIASGTAAIYGRFLGERKPGKIRSRRALDAGTTADIEVDGQLMYAPEKLQKMVLTAHDAGFPVSVHSIGDYSTDLVMDAFEQTGEPSRHRIEHAMILSDAQIERMAGLKLHCAFQPEFLARLGVSYRRQLGEDRASRLIRSRSVLDAGISTSFNSDRPIVAGNPWTGIAAASHRPDGFSQAENCTRAEAIRAYTSGGATANNDDGLMGTLDAGSIADFQVVDNDPLQAL